MSPLESTPSGGGPLISLSGLCKSFGGTQVVRAVDLELRAGEFVGLMGPNGAGKSTLIKMLSGVHEVDAGQIAISGHRVRSLAGRGDVGFIHQDLGLVDSMSVMDNLRLGAVPQRLVGPLLNRGREMVIAQDALDRVGLPVPLTAAVGTLSPGQKALLAVGRLLQQGAHFIVVDETTSTLPPKESRWVIETLRQATRSGTCVLMVSHKLSELLSAADRVVMLIDGRIVADRPVSPTDHAEVVRMLAEHEEQVVDTERLRTPASDASDVVESRAPMLSLRQVRWGSFGPFDLDVRPGEVVGLTGLLGSGLHTLGLLAQGVLRPRSGTVSVAPGVRRGLVAPQRETQGGVGDLSVLWNSTLSSLPRWRSRVRLVDLRRERADAVETLRALRVVPDDAEAPMRSLSGGNQQKVLFARTLLQEPGVFVLCEPTRGVDVGTRKEIYRLIRELRDDGAAILVVTSDSEDLFSVCDRIGVIGESGLTSLWDASGLTDEQLAEVL